jgi:hypothetical protein
MLVLTMQRLRDSCGASGNYDACTRFVAWKLDASCVPEKDGWGIHATASFTPWIVLLNIEKLSHELEHVRDVTRSAQQYAEELEGQRFASEADCRGRSIREAASFEDAVRRFAEESNALRHPLVYGRSSVR